MILGAHFGFLVDLFSFGEIDLIIILTPAQMAVWVVGLYFLVLKALLEGLKWCFVYF